MTTDPQHVRMKWSPDGAVAGQLPTTATGGWTVTDGDRAYFACDRSTNPNATTNAYPGFVVASNVGDNSPAIFSQGGPFLINE